jgi:hypothetical protein
LFDRLQSQIFDFLEAANRELPQELALCYGGAFLTGKTTNPEYLFLGINPGHGKWNERPRTFSRLPFAEAPCKFIEELEDDLRLAQRVVKIVLSGDASRLAACTETSVRSFFATPDVKILDQQLAALRPSGLEKRHQKLMAEALPLILETLSPKQIVCIGMTSFQSLVNLAGEKGQCIEMKSEKSASGKSDPVYYKKTLIHGIPVHGVLHLSGAYLSNAMVESLESIFVAR